jgi:glutamate N-acetyltransferase / amino-acid N-acetyltransferase
VSPLPQAEQNRRSFPQAALKVITLPMFKPEFLKPSALPVGFSLHGLRCGISSRAGKKDLALFYSERPASAAGVFTTNLVKAAPVVLSQKHLRQSDLARAVLINSGCANACTGERGMDDAVWSVREAAQTLGVPTAQILVASTGVIGRHLPRPALEKGIREILGFVKKRKETDVQAAVQSIMTTDTRPKAVSVRFGWQGRTFTVWGCAKGAGMIHPNMATMLSVMLTDIGLPASELRSALSWCAARTFNRVSVDGDTSTNDSLFLLANGAAGEFKTVPSALRAKFRSALNEACLSLSMQIAADGEGATRTAWIFVQGAKTERSAERLAATVATSALVKTALHGADPNWGRILAALGRAGEPFDPSKVEIRIGDAVVCLKGQRAEHSEKEVHRILKKDKVTIHIDLHQGKAGAHYVTCDYSKDYITINADYTT